MVLSLLKCRPAPNKPAARTRRSHLRMRVLLQQRRHGLEASCLGDVGQDARRLEPRFLHQKFTGKLLINLVCRYPARSMCSVHTRAGLATRGEDQPEKAKAQRK